MARTPVEVGIDRAESGRREPKPEDDADGQANDEADAVESLPQPAGSGGALISGHR